MTIWYVGIVGCVIVYLLLSYKEKQEKELLKIKITRNILNDKEFQDRFRNFLIEKEKEKERRNTMNE